MEKDKDYVEGFERFEELMGIYRQLKRLAGVLKVMQARPWQSVDVSAAKLLRLARKEKKTLLKKRIKPKR